MRKHVLGKLVAVLLQICFILMALLLQDVLILIEASVAEALLAYPTEAGHFSIFAICPRRLYEKG